MSLLYRKAQLEDIPKLQALITTSARALGTTDYSSAQIEAAIGTVWGVDEELIRDQTYFVIEAADGYFAGCGGWSKRKKLFGASKNKKEASPLLNPKTDSARIRAFFVHPDFARQGIGRAIIRLCEKEAVAANFAKIELMATLPGYRLYKSCGYSGDIVESIPCGETEYFHDCVAMYKHLVSLNG